MFRCLKYGVNSGEKDRWFVRVTTVVLEGRKGNTAEEGMGTASG